MSDESERKLSHGEWESVKKKFKMPKFRSLHVF